ncbi:MAG: right-handed parallel beta-helix repeat-containing protein, partial [Candidatus Thermoplasmatota archaeon]|nr:right-handed parallel beta-helix repeat-containing protein [Candidatus Thermoplasmatota archaeon]
MEEGMGHGVVVGADAGSVSIVDSRVRYNMGDGVLAQGSVSLSGTEVYGNGGAGVFVDGVLAPPSLEGCSVYGNAGGVCVIQGGVLIAGGSIFGNLGYGVNVSSSSGVTRLEGVMVSDHSGPGVFVDVNAFAQVAGCAFFDNVVGVYCKGSFSWMNITGNSFVNNTIGVYGLDCGGRVEGNVFRTELPGERVAGILFEYGTDVYSSSPQILGNKIERMKGKAICGIGIQRKPESAQVEEGNLVLVTPLIIENNTITKMSIIHDGSIPPALSFHFSGIYVLSGSWQGSCIMSGIYIKNNTISNVAGLTETNIDGVGFSAISILHTAKIFASEIDFIEVNGNSIINCSGAKGGMGTIEMGDGGPFSGILLNAYSLNRSITVANNKIINCTGGPGGGLLGDKGEIGTFSGISVNCFGPQVKGLQISDMEIENCSGTDSIGLKINSYGSYTTLANLTNLKILGLQTGMNIHTNLQQPRPILVAGNNKIVATQSPIYTDESEITQHWIFTGETYIEGEHGTMQFGGNVSVNAGGKLSIFGAGGQNVWDCLNLSGNSHVLLQDPPIWNEYDANIADTSSLTVQWTLRSYINGHEFYPGQEIVMTTKDVNEEVVWSGELDETGYINIVCKEYVQSASEKIYFTPHTIYAEQLLIDGHYGKVFTEREIMMDSTKYFFAELSDFYDDAESDYGFWSVGGSGSLWHLTSGAWGVPYYLSASTTLTAWNLTGDIGGETFYIGADMSGYLRPARRIIIG